MKVTLRVCCGLLSVVFIALFLNLGFLPVSAENSDTNCFRSITLWHMETLDENSKWCQEPLKTTLYNVLSNDLSDTSTCQQVWEFTTKDYDRVREWCLSNNKCSETNAAFLTEFEDNRIIYNID